MYLSSIMMTKMSFWRNWRIHKVVLNTTPLIALAGIGQLELLKMLYEEIYIPDAVMDELGSEPARALVEKV